MNSGVPSDKMQATGTVLSCLTGSTVIGMLIFGVAFVRSNTGRGTQAFGLLVQFVNGVASYLGYAILAAEGVALGFLVVGVIRWPSRIIRSARWMLSAVGIVLVAAAILVVAFFAATIAVLSP